MKLSRSVSLLMSSKVLPVCLARISLSRSLSRRISFAWMLMSDAWPCPPHPGRHARGLPDGVGVHVAGEILHRVVNRQTGRDAAAGRIDVKMDVLLRVGHLQKQKLRDDDVGNVVIHRRAEKNDAVHEQARVNVPRPLAAARLLDHDWNQKIFGVVHGNITTPFACKVKAGKQTASRKGAKTPNWIFS